MLASTDTERRLAAIEKQLGILLANSRPDQNTSVASSVTFAALSVSTVGTWTPAFTGTTIAGVYTYTNQQGYYVKALGMVLFWSRITISAIGTPPTGNMRISGLPFAAGGTYINSVLFGYIRHFKYTAAALALTGIITISATEIQLFETFTNALNVAVPAANFTNVACDLIFSGMYLF